MSPPPENPFHYFENWFCEAENHAAIEEANAMNLCTCTRDGLPSSRMVLLKEYNENGFCFYTNLGSRKAQQLDENPLAALCFYWEPLGRQVRIEGKVSGVDEKTADDYFASRPIRSRIGSWASKQSQPMKNRNDLLMEMAKQSKRFIMEDVPRPPFWSGFCLAPNYMEFWQRGKYRLHHRHSYQLSDSQHWHRQLLYP